MYNLLIKRQAKKKLQSLPVQARTRIAGQIQILGNDPDDKRLDLKKMKGQSSFRLRVGQWRVIFERDDAVRIISIEKIGVRGDVYK